LHIDAEKEKERGRELEPFGRDAAGKRDVGGREPKFFQQPRKWTTYL